MITRLLKMLKDMKGATINEVAILPDGSGFATASWPLPKDHWLYAEPSGYESPPMGLRMGTDHLLYKELKAHVRAAAEYAVRATTDNGKIEDYDPDAMCQNFSVGLLGYHTPDGLSSVDECLDPNPTASGFDKFMADDKLTGSEAVYGFMAWLTTRKEEITLGGSQDCAAPAGLVSLFCETNGLDKPRENWTDYLTHPAS